MQVVLENEALKVTINSFGAELASIRGKATDTEYLWNADAKFWKRTAPVLFPFVGSLKIRNIIMKERLIPWVSTALPEIWSLPWMYRRRQKHGFPCNPNEDKSKSENFRWSLSMKIGYELEGKELRSSGRWKIRIRKHCTFPSEDTPHLCALWMKKGKQSEYYFKFDTDKDLTYGLAADDGQGLMGQQKDVLPVKNGYAQITEHLFDRDALIVEDRQASAVSLCTPDKKPYVTLSFDAPLFGLWSPAGKGAPFICIEPWYGRCDKTTFDGSLEQREYSNTLQAGEVFRKEYTITIV